MGVTGLPPGGEESGSSRLSEFPTKSDNYSDNTKKPESTVFPVTQELATKNSDTSDNSFSAKATTATDGSHVVMGVVEGLDENFSPSCRNCRNDFVGVPYNFSPEPVLDNKAYEENQSEDVGIPTAPATLLANAIAFIFRLRPASTKTQTRPPQLPLNSIYSGGSNQTFIALPST